MKKLSYLLIICGAFLITNLASAQLAGVKPFDPAILKNKVLYIPTFEASERYIDKMSKKGKFDEISDHEQKVEYYNTLWKEAMAESSYDATDYEIKGYDLKQLIKSKNEEAIILTYRQDDYGNRTVSMFVTGPKKRTIAIAPITGFNLFDKGDLRLMINMLNESLNDAAETAIDGQKTSRSAARKDYKMKFVEWADNIADKTFLVPASEHQNEKKRDRRNEDLQDAIQYWKISNVKFTDHEEVEAKRVEGDPDHYFWRSIPVYTQSPLITYHYNLLISTESDDLLLVFMGKGRLKSSAVEQTQRKILSKADKFRQELAN